ncbi:MAG TPA: response regulator transcription factor [Candidatus Binatia bacterium]|nr:response regulator transcription factor [Candidatus Binatia bacterium]
MAKGDASADVLSPCALNVRRGPAEPGSRNVRILIIEDHEMLAQTLALALSPRFECTIADLSGGEAVVDQARSVRPALVLLDLGLEGIDGLDLIPGLRASGAQVLVVTGCTDAARLGAAVALGASGWVSKAEPFERLLAAAEAVMLRRPLLGEAERQELVQQGSERLEAERELRRRFAELTGREREVLWALSEGESAAQVASALGVSIGTVRCHIQAILSKLEVSSQLAAVARARLLLTTEGASGRTR